MDTVELTTEQRREAIEAVAQVLRKLPDGLPSRDVAEVVEAALRQVVRCHVVVQTVRVDAYATVRLCAE